MRERFSILRSRLAPPPLLKMMVQLKRAVCIEEIQLFIFLQDYRLGVHFSPA